MHAITDARRKELERELETIAKNLLIISKETGLSIDIEAFHGVGGGDCNMLFMHDHIGKDHYMYSNSNMQPEDMRGVLLAKFQKMEDKKDEVSKAESI